MTTVLAFGFLRNGVGKTGYGIFQGLQPAHGADSKPLIQRKVRFSILSGRGADLLSVTIAVRIRVGIFVCVAILTFAAYIQGTFSLKVWYGKALTDIGRCDVLDSLKNSSQKIFKTALKSTFRRVRHSVKSQFQNLNSLVLLPSLRGKDTKL